MGRNRKPWPRRWGKLGRSDYVVTMAIVAALLLYMPLWVSSLWIDEPASVPTAALMSIIGVILEVLLFVLLFRTVGEWWDDRKNGNNE